MTRINIVPPQELTDQHLVAEYREIFMVGSSLQRSMKSDNWPRTLASIPKEYTLNEGHVKFFYNKGLYLALRYLDLKKEMRLRGMHPDPARKFKYDQWPKELYNDWEPNEKDLAIARQRINERISKKSDWYRKTAYCCRQIKMTG